jgi:hypothetical protein
MDLREKYYFSVLEEVLQKAPDFSNRCRIIRQLAPRKMPSLTLPNGQAGP